MKALFLTNEYPPNIYGGAGVHVDYLTRELSRIIDVEVRCFGDQHVQKEHLTVTGFGLDDKLFSCCKELKSALGAASRCVNFNATNIDADIVHCHTWYTHLGGILAKLNYGAKLVITIHSLEPLRPWKREQLGHAYDFSCWVEKTAIEMADSIIAVSKETKRDVLKFFNVDEKKIACIYNGIDLAEYVPQTSKNALAKYGVDPDKPYVLFVGRITRQKGIIHLVNAIPHIDPSVQVVLCAGAPDTPEIAQEMNQGVARVKEKHSNVIWIQEMLGKKDVIELYTHASVFCCPSIYEPFGIINLEAMACETAVVASAVGGIKEVVVPGETGYLVELEQQQESPFEPVNPAKFSADLAGAINKVVRDPALQKTMGKKGRARVEQIFSWKAIAEQTANLYESLIK